MKERPIIFGGPMVNAIRDGIKTQTRRIVKCKFLDYGGVGGRGSVEWDDPSMWGYMHENGEWSMLKPSKGDHQIPCPYGVPGDRLWVRETFCQKFGTDYEPQYFYKADSQCVMSADDSGFFRYRKDGSEASPWKPSIHMPRVASRITLDITDIWCERLNSISESDSVAEGVASREEYAIFWETIHGPSSWSANPFVWVIRFSVIEAGGTDAK